jgi:ABC-type Mn2+/Zn2+ transport system ATPase subunit
MLISINALSLRIGDARILHDVRLSLDEGEIHAASGLNGTGKSTTIAGALGVLRPEAGTNGCAG